MPTSVQTLILTAETDTYEWKVHKTSPQPADILCSIWGHMWIRMWPKTVSRAPPLFVTILQFVACLKRWFLGSWKKSFIKRFTEWTRSNTLFFHKPKWKNFTVCVCICMCTYVCIHVHVYCHTCICIRTCVCVFTHVYADTYLCIFCGSVQRPCCAFFQVRKVSLAFRELKETKETKVSLDLKVGASLEGALRIWLNSQH